eukprot:6198724-Pleurochrysis_carterae.AAC.1
MGSVQERPSQSLWCRAWDAARRAAEGKEKLDATQKKEQNNVKDMSNNDILKGELRAAQRGFAVSAQA